METIYKVLEDCEVKKLGERQYEFTASTETQDRDGEVISVAGWNLKNFEKNPVIMYAHDYRSLPIGKATKVWVSGKKLKNTVEFPPEGTYEFADIVERLVDTGYLKTQSVGFIPKEWTDGDGEKSPRRTFTKQELLEISIVPVPSNPDALRSAVNQGVITAKEFKSITEDITKPEEDDDWIRIPVDECDVTATIDISKKEGIKALYCGEEKKVQTYMFDKREPYNWTMAKAKKWVEEHKGLTEPEEVKEEGIEVEKHPEPRITSQQQIIDELDYLIRLIDTEGMNDEVQEDAWNLVREIMRLHGDDIPLDIAEKVGAVLNQKNRDRLNQIQALAQQVLDSAEKPEEPKCIPEPSKEEITEVVAKAVKEELDRLRGKI